MLNFFYGPQMHPDSLVEEYEGIMPVDWYIKNNNCRHGRVVSEAEPSGVDYAGMAASGSWGFLKPEVEAEMIEQWQSMRR